MLWILVARDLHSLVHIALQGSVSRDGLLRIGMSNLVDGAVELIRQADGVVLVNVITCSDLAPDGSTPNGVRAHLQDIDIVAVALNLIID